MDNNREHSEILRDHIEWCCDILGVSYNASLAEIKAAYRKRALELHPDHNPDADANIHFQALNTSYTFLTDLHRRIARRKADRQARQNEERQGNAQREQVRQEYERPEGQQEKTRREQTRQGAEKRTEEPMSQFNWGWFIPMLIFGGLVVFSTFWIDRSGTTLAMAICFGLPLAGYIWAHIFQK
jgi:lipopolysaccharide export LptBFGC system permease protein LptF